MSTFLSPIAYFVAALILLLIGLDRGKPEIAVPAALLGMAYALWSGYRAWRDRDKWAALERSSKALDEVVKRAKQLEKTDQAAADHLIEEYFAGEEAREHREVEELQLRARTDLAAARRLRARMETKLKDLRAGRQMFERELKNDPSLPTFLQQAEQDEAQTSRALAEAEMNVRRLQSRSA